MKETLKPGYKHTALGVLPAEWEVKDLGMVSKITSGGTPNREKHEYWGGDIPWITTSQIDFNEINEAEEFITEEGLNNSSAKLFQPGTLLMALYGQGVTRGKVSTLKIPAATNQACAAIIVDKDFASREFLFQFFVHSYENIRNLSNSGSQQNLSGGILKSLQLPLPPLPEQRKIASVLATWDRAIETQTALIATLQKRHQALMQRLLAGKVRLKGFEGEWKEVRLGEVFNRVTRKNTEGNKTVVTISAQRGFVLQTDFFNKNVASDITDNYFLVEHGEFCYNKSYSNGYPWGATKRLTQFEKAVVTTLYICFGIKNEKQNFAPFFEHFFEGGLIEKGLMKIAHEGGRAHGLLNVTPTDFFNLDLWIPSFSEQKAIAQILSTSEAEIAGHRRQLAALKEQKKGLMQVLLTGKLRVKTGTTLPTEIIA